MRKNRRFLNVFGISLVFIFCVTSFVFAGGGTAKEEQFVIGYTTCDSANTFVVACDIGVAQSEEDFGVKLLWHDAANDIETELAGIENMIAQGAQAIIITVVDTNAGKAYHDITAAAKIPLIIMNRQIQPFDEYGQGFKYGEGFVGTDTSKAGYVMIEGMIEALGGKGKVGWLHGRPGESAEVMRTDAVTEVLKDYPDIEVIVEDTASWDRTEAINKVEAWIAAGYEFDGIICQSDEMQMGAMLALEDAGMLEGVKLCSIDGLRDNMENIKKGKLTLTVYQSTFDLGYKSVEMAVRMLKEGKYPPTWEWIDVPYQLVTQENVDKFLAMLP